MRYCSASAVRILTLFSLVVLASHSFILPANAQGSVSTPSPTPPTSISTPTSSLPVDTPPTHSSGTTSQSPSPSPSKPPSSPSPSSTPPTTASPNQPSDTASSPSAQPSDTSTSTTSSSTSTSSPLSSSSSSSSSSTSTSTSTSTSAATTLAVADSNPTQNVVNPSDTASYMHFSNTQGIVHPTGNSEETGSVNGAASQGSGTSFFDNKGAVAGTFFAVALVVIGLIVAAVILFKRRRRHLRYEEDEVYFEKYHEPQVQQDRSPPTGAMGGMAESSHDIAIHARTDAYPDRAIHHGWVPPSAEAEFGNPQEYGMEYPPGTAYAAAQSQGGGQYQYSGETGYGTQAYARTSPGPHPFADPHNSIRRGVAPPVGSTQSRSIESHYTTQSSQSSGYAGHGY